MCGSCHLDKESVFEVGVECQKIYLLIGLLIDQREGRSQLQFSYRNHATFSKPWMCPKMCFTATLKNTSIKIILYSTPISTFKWHDPHIKTGCLKIRILKSLKWL